MRFEHGRLDGKRDAWTLSRSVRFPRTAEREKKPRQQDDQPRSGTHDTNLLDAIVRVERGRDTLIQMSTPLYLIDASPYIFRAFFSIDASMTTPDGRPANAVYGFTRFLMKLIEDEQPHHMAVTFDKSLNTSFRNEIYPAYKAQRELPPADLEAQLDWCEQMTRALGAATFINDRYEADDLIAGIRRHVHADGHPMVIVTSDKDLAQLVDATTTLWDYARDQRYDENGVRAKFGVRPDQIVDYLGLAGDSVDNIPGVRGVGAKTATALLAAFDGLEDLYAGLDRVATLPIRGAKTLGAKLADQRESAFLSRRLATVADDLPATLTREDLILEAPRAQLLDPLLATLGFERLRGRLGRTPP